MPFTDYSYATGLSALSGAIDGIGTAVKDAQKRSALQTLGKQIQSGDLDGAAQTAFAAGDVQTGTALIKLGQSSKANAELGNLLGGLYGGGNAAGAPASPSAGAQTSSAEPIDTKAIPSFVQSAGQGVGVDPSYLARTFQIESRGNPNAVSPTGAKGLGQFTTSTWKTYGAGFGSPFDPNANAVATANLTADNADALAQSLGREPTQGEVYLAHQQGLGGARALLSNPGANVVDALAPAYKGDRAAAARAVAVNGGDPSMSAGAFASRWTSKFPSTPVRIAGADDGSAPAAPSADQSLPGAGRVMTLSDAAISAETPAAQPAQIAQGTIPAGTRFSLNAGAKANPSGPATSYAGPAIVAANKDLFVNPDTGQPRTVAEAASIMNGNAAPAAAAQPVRTASADPRFVPQTPAAPVAAAPAAAASDPLVVVPGINGGKPINKAWVAAAPDGTDVPDDGVLEQAQAAALKGAQPPAPAQVAQAAPQPAAMSAAAPRAIAQTPGMPAGLAPAIANNGDPSRRAQILMRAMLIPGLGEQQQGLLKTLLANELDQSKLPDQVKQYMFARSQDPSVGTFTQWSDRNQETKTPDAITKVNDAITNWQKYRLPDPNDPANAGFWRDFSAKTLGGGGGVTINNNPDKVQSQADQELGKAKVSDVVDAINAAKPARERLQTLSTLADAWKSGDGKITTGPLGESAMKLKQFAQGSLGINPTGLTETELVQKVGTQLAAQASKELTQRPTQFDFQVFLANNPGLTMSPKGNLALISLMQQRARHEIALAGLARQQKNGDNWDQVVADFDKAHPIISPLTGKPLDPNEVVFPAPSGQQPATSPAGATSGSAPAQAAPRGAMAPADAAQSLANARAALARNPAARGAILKRLQDAGIDAGGL